MSFKRKLLFIILSCWISAPSHAFLAGIIASLQVDSQLPANGIATPYNLNAFIGPEEQTITFSWETDASSSPDRQDLYIVKYRKDGGLWVTQEFDTGGNGGSRSISEPFDGGETWDLSVERCTYEPDFPNDRGCFSTTIGLKENILIRNAEEDGRKYEAHLVDVNHDGAKDIYIRKKQSSSNSSSAHLDSEYVIKGIPSNPNPYYGYFWWLPTPPQANDNEQYESNVELWLEGAPNLNNTSQTDIVTFADPNGGNRYLFQAPNKEGISLIFNIHQQQGRVIQEYASSTLSGSNISAEESFLETEDLNGDNRADLIITNIATDEHDAAYSRDDGELTFQGFGLIAVDESSQPIIQYYTEKEIGSDFELQCLVNTTESTTVTDVPWYHTCTTCQNQYEARRITTTTTRRGGTWQTIETQTVQGDSVNIGAPHNPTRMIEFNKIYSGAPNQCTYTAKHSVARWGILDSCYESTDHFKRVQQKFRIVHNGVVQNQWSERESNEFLNQLSNENLDIVSSAAVADIDGIGGELKSIAEAYNTVPKTGKNCDAHLRPPEFFITVDFNTGIFEGGPLVQDLNADLIWGTPYGNISTSGVIDALTYLFPNYSDNIVSRIGAIGDELDRLVNGVNINPGSGATRVTDPVRPEHASRVQEFRDLALQAGEEIYEENKGKWYIDYDFPFARMIRGNKIHNRYSKIIKEEYVGDSYYHSEITYKDGRRQTYSTRGAIRADAAYGHEAGPEFAIELKTGIHVMSPRQYSNYKDNLPLGTPVYTINIYEELQP